MADEFDLEGYVSLYNPYIAGVDEEGHIVDPVSIAKIPVFGGNLAGDFTAGAITLYLTEGPLLEVWNKTVKTDVSTILAAIKESNEDLEGGGKVTVRDSMSFAGAYASAGGNPIYFAALKDNSFDITCGFIIPNADGDNTFTGGRGVAANSLYAYPAIYHYTPSGIYYWAYLLSNKSFHTSNPSYINGNYESDVGIDFLGNISSNPNLIYIDNIKVSPEPITLSRGSSVQLSATAEYQDGATLELDPSKCGWTVSNQPNVEGGAPDGISISGSGVLSASADTNVSLFYVNVFFEDSDIYSYIAYISDAQPPYSPGDSPSGGTSQGGGGTHDPGISTPTEIPFGSSELDSSSAGIFTRYYVTPGQLSAFGNWLWADSFLDAAFKELMQSFYGSPFDAIISVMSYPMDVTKINGFSKSSGTIFFGNRDSGISGDPIGNGFGQFDWGTISLREYWGNFLDYAPHTKVELYLPWYGFVNLDPNECLPGTLNVVTNFELDRGTCTHIVKGNGGVCIATYSTVIGKQLPINALDTGGKALAMTVAGVAAVAAVAVSAGAAAPAVGGAVAAGGAASSAPAIGAGTGLMAGAMSSQLASLAVPVSAGAAGAASAMPTLSHTVNPHMVRLAATSAVAASRQPQVLNRSGSSTGCSAGLGPQYPYVIVSRPRQSVPGSYGYMYGYPCNKTARLSSLNGYTEVGAIHLEGIPCTQQELDEIYAMLQGGVIL